ncbi:MAG TPA: AI-2E family transporter [Candidatus Dormibacteraeota bacterium]
MVTDPQSRWQHLYGPARALVWLLIALSVVSLYHGAEFLVVHVFSVVLLFTFAAIVALVLTPVVDGMQRVAPFRWHRGATVLALYLAIVGAVAAAVTLVVPSIVTQARHLPDLAARLQTEIDRRGLHLSLAALRPSGSALDIGAAVSLVSGVISTVTSVVLVLVISIYLLIEGRVLIATLRNLFPRRARAFDFTVLAVGATVGAYVRGQLLMSCLIGLYTAVAMTLLGVHYGILIGVAAFFLEFVPVVGAVVAMGLAVVIALLQSPLLALLAAIAGIVGHALDAYIVGPRVNGRVTQLHPLVAMAALIVGAELGGILGALFAVPVAAIANIFLGALYRSRRGDEALSTQGDGAVTVDSLPRLGEEIGGVEEAGVIDEPVPHCPGEGEAA